MRFELVETYFKFVFQRVDEWVWVQGSHGHLAGDNKKYREIIFLLICLDVRTKHHAVHILRPRSIPNAKT